jgi:hypothetical protein
MNKPMPKGVAADIVGGLSRTSKMPGPSFGTSAFDCQTGSKLRAVEGSVCASCYARKGQYVWPVVREAHARRMSKLLKAIANPEARVQWVSAMASLLEGVSHFRWHDSGDLQSKDHFALVVDVVRATPKTKHWLPTKEPRYVDRKNIPANLVVRVSAPMVDQAGPKTWPNVSTVHTDRALAGAHVCPAPKQGGACGKCRACWTRTVATVSYHQH